MPVIVIQYQQRHTLLLQAGQFISRPDEDVDEGPIEDAAPVEHPDALMTLRWKLGDPEYDTVCDVVADLLQPKQVHRPTLSGVTAFLPQMKAML